MQDKPRIVIGLAIGLAIAVAAVAFGADAPDQGPETVMLDSLVSLYQPVEFDHATHVELVEDCASCHHHTTGTEVTDERCAKCHEGTERAEVVSCRGCHAAEPFTVESLKGQEANRFHLDKVGLKGAYHLGCTGCHQEMGGPTKCRDCHERTPEGDAFYRIGTAGAAGASGEKSGH